MACKVPGRVKKTCGKCGKPFSTHSSNRSLCHTCLPKCRERHAFSKVMAKMYKEPQPPVTVSQQAYTPGTTEAGVVPAIA